MTHDDRPALNPELDEREREALLAFTVSAPPPDFASAAVQAALGASSPRRRPKWRVAAMVAASAAAAALLLVWSAPRLPRSGEWHVSERTTLALGRRAVAVAEAGAAAEWRLALSGDVWVEQKSGDVFYRVEPGGEFVVQTPAGTVQVTGTCLRLELTTTMTTMTSHWKAGAVGAAAAAALVVTVYEGRVVAKSAAQEVALGPGERATLTADGEITRTDAATGAANSAAKARGQALAAAAANDLAVPPALAAEPVVVALQRDRLALRDQIETLQNEIEELKKKNRGQKTFDLTPEELMAMAEECEVRWDWVVPSSIDPPKVMDEWATEAKLSDDERAKLNEVMARYNQDIFAAIAREYTAITGDPNTGSLAVESMFAEAADKTPRAQIKSVYQRVAQERAGMVEPADNALAQTPYERMFRVIHGAGDQLEQMMSEVIGPDRAHAVRSQRNGFGSKNRTRNGCPNDK